MTFRLLSSKREVQIVPNSFGLVKKRVAKWPIWVILLSYVYIYISHKTKGCDIWPPLKSQFGKRFLTGSIVLYSF